MTNLEVVIPISAITGLISGAVIPLFKPLIDWGIEKKRKKQELRISLLKDCKHYIDGWLELKASYIINKSFYASLRPYLDKNLVREIESKTKNLEIIHIGNKRLDEKNYLKSRLLDEIARLEKKWKLI